MDWLTGLRRASRALPVSPALLHRARRLAGVGFGVAAWARHGHKRLPQSRREGPVCVVGFHGSVLGIGEAARAFAGSLRQAGGEVVEWDISALFGHPVRLDSDAPQEPPAEAASLVVFLNPLELVQLIGMTGGAPFRDRFCVGFWFWELEQTPARWAAALRYVDEVWVASRFVADAVKARAPEALPVRVLPCPVEARVVDAPRGVFGLPDEKLVVLTAFDVRSGFTRKNPIAAVRAFREAAVSDRAVMVCKAAGVEGAPDLVRALRDEIGDRGDVRLMTEWLSGAEMRALVARADIALSLHRSEGFGLLPAQAMAAGKAVVATGWSANLDFMTPDNSMLVDYTLIPVRDPQNLYDGGRWAEADVQDAAAKLRRLVDDPELRRRLGARAAADIGIMLDPIRLGLKARGWLAPGGAEEERRGAG